MNINKLVFFALLTLFSCNEQVEFLSYENVDSHIRMLSSDEMLGRDPYSEDIKIAENYIAEKFKKAGLSEFPEFKNYRHSFPLFLSKVNPENTYLNVNGNKIEDVIILASGNITAESYSLDQLSSAFTVSEAGKDDNPQRVINPLFRNYKKNWIWLDPAHKNLIGRFKSFARREISSRVNPENDPRFLIIAVKPPGKIRNIELSINSTTREVILTNIAGYLEGSDPELKDEYFVFTAHHDHLGVNHDLKGVDKIFNGADDNATGVTGVITLAEHFSYLGNSKRSIMFVTFTAEEKGLIGSNQLVDDLPFPKEKLIGMINFEMLGKKSKWGWNRTFLTGFEHSDLGEIMQTAIPDTSVFNVYPDPYGLFLNSDNAPFARAGITSHTLSSTDVMADQNYHKVTDEYETLNIDNMLTVIKGVADAVAPILSGSRTPSKLTIERN